MVVITTVLEMQLHERLDLLVNARKAVTPVHQDTISETDNQLQFKRSITNVTFETIESDKQQNAVVADEQQEVDIWNLLKKPDTWGKLMATGGGWLIYDVAYCKSTNLCIN